MNDIKTFDSAQFGEYLLNSGIVPVGKEKFMVIWARKFFASRSQWPDFPWHEQITLFLKQLDESGSESWQLRQADQAVRLYFNNFLGKGNININHAHSSQLDPPVIRLTFQQALLKFTENLRLKNYARSTEKTYLYWIKQFLQNVHQQDTSINNTQQLTQGMVKDYLAFLAIKQNVAASTQNQAFNALLSFFRIALNTDLFEMQNSVRAKPSQHLPVVFSVTEVKNLLSRTSGTTALMLKMIYGGGLRVSECCRLRIKDIDFDQHLLYVRNGKGGVTIQQHPSCTRSGRTAYRCMASRPACAHLKRPERSALGVHC